MCDEGGQRGHVGNPSQGPRGEGRRRKGAEGCGALGEGGQGGRSQSERVGGGEGRRSDGRPCWAPPPTGPGVPRCPEWAAPPEGGLERTYVRQFGRRRDWWYTNDITLVKGGEYFVGMVAGEEEGGGNSRETAEDLGPDPDSAWGQRRKLSHTWGQKRGAVGQPAGRPGHRDRFGLGVPGEAAEATATGH